jgi:hypothetical protein
MRAFFIASAAILVSTPAFAAVNFNACQGALEFAIPARSGVTFEAAQRRDEVPRFTISSNHDGVWIDDPLDALANPDKNFHDLGPQKNPKLYSPSSTGFCVRASGWWQWGNGPQNHQSFTRIEAHRLSPTEGVVNYFIDGSNNPDAILKVHFHQLGPPAPARH